MVQARKRTKPRPATPKQAAKVRQPVDGLLDPAFFQALADPTRVKLLACLIKCGRGCTVGEVGECCAVDLSVVSRHLSALAKAGVLEGRKHGRTVTYHVRAAEVCERLRGLADAVEACCVGGCGAGCGGGCGCGEGGCCG